MFLIGFQIRVKAISQEIIAVFCEEYKWNNDQFQIDPINTYILFYRHLVEIFNIREDFDRYVDEISDSQIRKAFNGMDKINKEYKSIMDVIGVKYNYLYDFVSDYRMIYTSRKYKSARN